MLYDQVLEAVETLHKYTRVRPMVGLVLGSGLGDLVEEIEEAVVIPYEEIPHFARSTIVGHVGRLLVGGLEGVAVVAMQGRLHMYEGYSPHTVTFPVRVMRELGVEIYLVSNVAGGVNPMYRAGDFMLMRDHIFLPGMMGLGPMMGAHDERLGVRFPAMAQAYDADLRALARQVASQYSDITLHEGIYTMLTGPCYETPAELRFLRVIGSDAVGMSTVPEVVVARQIGMRVIGVSLISNIVTGDEGIEVKHEEVLEVAAAARSRFAVLMRGIIKGLTH